MFQADFSPRVPPFWPPIWSEFFDQHALQWAKKTYLPERFSKKARLAPFSAEDVRFFGPAVGDLSELFTDAASLTRKRQSRSYFSHARNRSAYILYFLPVNAAKFMTLFDQEPRAMEAALSHARDKGVLRVVDLGSGPGTATIAFILWCLSRRPEDLKKLNRIEITWVDENIEIMKDGKALIIEYLQAAYPELATKTMVQTIKADWRQAKPPGPFEASLILSGNILNESHRDARLGPPLESLARWLSFASGGGWLFIEPAEHKSSQLLSRLRDLAFTEGLIAATPESLWGPCLHAGLCPLASGRDWCHFSVRARLPGPWFHELSRAIGPERNWLKFSYLWISARSMKAPKLATRLRRVVSDLMPVRTGDCVVLLCEPERPRRHPLRANSRVLRGDILEI